MTGQSLFVVLSGVLFLMLLSGTFGHLIPKHLPYPKGGTLPNGGKIWALLVAGSNGYFNYRHQADVCHAYQILHKNGIPDENIVVMMYDDVARDLENPTPNVLINKPGGPDVYTGVPIDYREDDVTVQNFLAVLTGNTSALSGKGSGKVIKSGPKDHIFINFVDHGAPGFLCFPSDELHAKLLESTLERMVAANHFAKMVLYVEACESGSMFDAILPDTDDIFVVTAADPKESSFACYYDKLRKTYLGDVFSVNWMEDSDQSENLMKESLHHQFERVRTETNQSHVEEYGDLNLGSLPVGYFQGYNGRFLKGSSWKNEKTFQIEDAISSRDVPLEILKRRIESASDQKSRKKYQFQLRRAQKLRRHFEGIFSDIVSFIAQGDHERTALLLTASNRLTHDKLDCYESVVKYFSKKCFKISKNPFILSKMNVFVNVCSVEWASYSSAKKAMDALCVPENRITGIL